MTLRNTANINLYWILYLRFYTFLGLLELSRIFLEIFLFQTRSYRVNVDAGIYQYYVGDVQIHRGKLHNLYFRLHERSSTGQWIWSANIWTRIAAAFTVAGDRWIFRIMLSLIRHNKMQKKYKTRVGDWNNRNNLGSCHFGPSGLNGKIRVNIFAYGTVFHVEREKDLGLMVASTFNWTEQCNIVIQYFILSPLARDTF